jgi:hypothetical protein
VLTVVLEEGGEAGEETIKAHNMAQVENREQRA